MGTDIGKRIRFQRESLRITQEELAKKLGYKNKSSIAKIEIGENDIPQSKVVAFANALNTTVAYLMGWVDNANSSSDYIDDLVSKHPDIHRIEKRSFPMLGSVACGKPIMADQQYDSFVLADADIDADYCLTASGDSMINARIFDGDIVFVKKQDMVDNGDIAVVIIDDDVTLKRVFYYPETQTLRLQAENPLFYALKMAWLSHYCISMGNFVGNYQKGEHSAPSFYTMCSAIHALVLSFHSAGTSLVVHALPVFGLISLFAIFFP